MATTKKRPAKKTAAKKRSAAKTTTTKAAAKRPAKKAAARKTAAKKRPAKKATARKTGAKKRTAAPRDLQAVRPVGFARDREFWEQRCRTTVSGDVTVHCGDLSGPVVDFIAGAQSIVGCVAWITSRLEIELAEQADGVTAHVTLTARDGDPQELKRIVDAIIDAYNREIVAQNIRQ